MVGAVGDSPSCVPTSHDRCEGCQLQVGYLTVSNRA